mgnify:CR=1 FL=1
MLDGIQELFKYVVRILFVLIIVTALIGRYLHGKKTAKGPDGMGNLSGGEDSINENEEI